MTLQPGRRRSASTETVRGGAPVKLRYPFCRSRNATSRQLTAQCEPVHLVRRRPSCRRRRLEGELVSVLATRSRCCMGVRSCLAWCLLAMLASPAGAADADSARAGRSTASTSEASSNPVDLLSDAALRSALRAAAATSAETPARAPVAAPATPAITPSAVAVIGPSTAVAAEEPPPPPPPPTPWRSWGSLLIGPLLIVLAAAALLAIARAARQDRRSRRRRRSYAPRAPARRIDAPTTTRPAVLQAADDRSR